MREAVGEFVVGHRTVECRVELFEIIVTKRKIVEQSASSERWGEDAENGAKEQRQR